MLKSDNKTKQQNRTKLIEKFVEAYRESPETMRVMEVGRKIRSKGYATVEELLELVKWKFPIAVRHVNIPNNTEDDVRKLTSLVLKENLSDSQKVRILMGLTGVKVRMASAILTLIFPGDYGTFDINARKALEDLDFIGENELSNYTLSDFLEYLRIIRKIAKKLTCTPREIDRALYYYGRHLNKKCHIDGNCPICHKNG